jgi:hypothetical protein
VPDGVGDDREIADPDLLPGLVLGDRERRIEEPAPLVDRRREVLEVILAAGRQVQRARRRGGLAPREAVPQRSQVDPVIGVEVADDDPVEVQRADRRLDPRRDPAADVEEDCGRLGLDENPRGAGVGQWSGGSRSEDRQAHEGSLEAQAGRADD